MRSTTANDIKKVFLQLLNEKPFDKITVREITETCGINRNTFYYYFQDVYDLLESVLDSASKEALSRNIEYDSWEEGFIKSTEFARENRRAIYHIYKSAKREKLDKYLNDIAERVMTEAIKKQTEGLEVCENDVRLVVTFYKHALVGCVTEWLDEGMKGTPVEDIRRLGELLEGNIRHSLSKHLE